MQQVTTRVEETKAALEKAEFDFSEAKRRGLPGVALLKRAMEDAQLEHEAAVQAAQLDTLEAGGKARIEKALGLKADLEKRMPDIMSMLGKIETAADVVYNESAALEKLVQEIVTKAGAGYIQELAGFGELVEKATEAKISEARRVLFKELHEAFEHAPARALAEVERQVKRGDESLRRIV